MGLRFTWKQPKAGSLSILGEMRNLMCQVDWATGYPGIWFKITLGDSEAMFLETLKFESADKGDGPPHVNRPCNLLEDFIEPASA